MPTPTATMLQSATNFQDSKPHSKTSQAPSTYFSGSPLSTLWCWSILDVLFTNASNPSIDCAPWCSFPSIDHHTSMAPLRSPPKTPFAYLWNCVGFNPMVFGGGSIFKWPTFSIKGERCDLLLTLLGIMFIFRKDVVHKVKPMLRWVSINPLTYLF